MVAPEEDSATTVPVTLIPVDVVSSFLVLSWYKSTEPSLLATILSSFDLPLMRTSPPESWIIKSPVPVFSM